MCIPVNKEENINSIEINPFYTEPTTYTTYIPSPIGESTIPAFNQLPMRATARETIAIEFSFTNFQRLPFSMINVDSIISQTNAKIAESNTKVKPKTKSQSSSNKHSITQFIQKSPRQPYFKNKNNNITNAKTNKRSNCKKHHIKSKLGSR